MNYKTKEDIRYYISVFRKDLENSKTVKQKKFYAGIINTLVDAVNEDDVIKLKSKPNAYDLECAVLGCVLNSQNIGNTLHKLNEKVFYNSNHRKIFKVAKKLLKLNIPIDILTVTNELRKNKINLDAYCIELSQKISSTAHLDFYVHVLLQFFIRRYYIDLATKLKEKAFNDDIDVFDLMEYSEKKLTKINQFIKEVGKWSKK